MIQKDSKIFMQEWLDLHTYQRNNSDDQWYLNLATKLLTVINEIESLNHLSAFLKKTLALSLAVYLEDGVSEGGGWNRFKAEFIRLYDKQLPFYMLDATYIVDEINVDDVQFILWSVLSLNEDAEGNIEFVNPLELDLLMASDTLYGVLDGVFEEAPVTEAKSVDWIMDLDQLKRKPKALPTFDLKDCKSDSSRKFLTYTNGDPLQFFATYEEMKKFFIDVLEWENKPDALMPEMEVFTNFILFANSKGLLLAPEAAPYFDSPKNSLYNEDKAIDEGYLLFCEEGNCPYDLLKYGMAEGMLNHIELPVPNGRLLFIENQDFISRWFLGEYYEGD